MNVFHELINSVALVLNIIGALIIIWGVILALLEFLKKETTPQKESVRLNESIRIKLGSYLVLALEFFVAGDIIKTIIIPSWKGLGILGAIVAIRTILSYFLTRDIKRI